MRALLAGGGTLGPVAPLLAVADILRARGWDAEFVGTPCGPEAAVVGAAGFRFTSIPVAKLVRGWSPSALKLPAHALASLRIARSILRERRPSVVLGAGGFTEVPVAYAASTRRIPVVVHQQDVVPSLSNRLVAPVASAITVSLPGSVRWFPASKVRLTGNPVRADIKVGDRQRGRDRFGLRMDRPCLLVLGGGTGALGLNRPIASALDGLLEFSDVLHLTGSGRGGESPRSGYVPVERVDKGMGDVLAVADAVVCRGGFATLTEVLQLDLPVLAVPMPRSHQEANVRVFSDARAIQSVAQASLTASELVSKVRELLAEDRTAIRAARAPYRWEHAAAAVADVVEAVVR